MINDRFSYVDFAKIVGQGGYDSEFSNYISSLNFNSFNQNMYIDFSYVVWFTIINKTNIDNLSYDLKFQDDKKQLLKSITIFYKCEMIYQFDSIGSINTYSKMFEILTNHLGKFFLAYKIKVFLDVDIKLS